MLPTVFPHEVNKGYSNWASVLKSVNDTKIKSFKHLVEVIDNIDTKYTKFEFEEQLTIVLDTKQARNSFKSIQPIYRLNSDRSIK